MVKFNEFENYVYDENSDENAETQKADLELVNLGPPEDKKGFIQLPKVDGNKYFNGLKYNIILSTGMSIVSTTPQSEYTLSINTRIAFAYL